jgi:aryl-alcohol dehydrogenase-like predicted oxidoreductase
VDTISLGGLSVSALGLGCMGMSEGYGSADWDTSIATIRRALELGVTLFDTSDIYGSGHNEVLLGRAIAGHRDQVELATKTGIDRSMGDDAWTLRGEPAYLKRACEASLLRLGVDVIDLYYLHRAPQTVPIEEAIGALAELVAEGKVRHLGLSEVDGDLLRRAHGVHPITAVQNEYSLWSRDSEATVLPTMRELGVALVPYSPLGRGFLTATLDQASLEPTDSRRYLPRFAGEAADANQAISDTVRAVAEANAVAPAQVALAWVHTQNTRLGVPVVPIPGTRKIGRLEQNVAALGVELSDDQLRTLDGLAARVVGSRY